jgi:CTP synthase (UTP-ammonia lyase)
LRIGLIGDYYPEITAHRAIARSFETACFENKTRRITTTWLGTDTLEKMSEAELKNFDGFWCVPGSPYASMAGALRGIQFARENGVPFLGTCAGFQHALVEYVRNALGIAGADNAETNPDALCVVITRLVCPMVEKASEVVLREGTRLRAIIGRSTSTEQYHCNFGLALDGEALLTPGDVRISARGHDGRAHAIELINHPFYIATLFQPERAALRGKVHPLVRAFIEAVALTSESNGARPRQANRLRHGRRG